MSPVISALFSDCFWNMLYVFLEIKPEIRSESGVRTITTMATRKFVRIIKKSVPIIVITPVKSCVKPIKRPSAI